MPLSCGCTHHYCQTLDVTDDPPLREWVANMDGLMSMERIAVKDNDKLPLLTDDLLGALSDPFKLLLQATDLTPTF